MSNAIKMWSLARALVVLSALVICASILWVKAPAHGQITHAVDAVMDRSRIAIDAGFGIWHGSEAEVLALVLQRLANSRSGASVVHFDILATSAPRGIQGETFTYRAAFRAFAASAFSAHSGQRRKALLSTPRAATLRRPLP